MSKLVDAGVTLDNALETQFSATEKPVFQGNRDLEKHICDALKEAQCRAIQEQK